MFRCCATQLWRLRSGERLADRVLGLHLRLNQPRWERRASSRHLRSGGFCRLFATRASHSFWLRHNDLRSNWVLRQLLEGAILVCHTHTKAKS